MKRLLSLFLTLALCTGAALTVQAAGKEVYFQGKGVSATLKGVIGEYKVPVIDGVYEDGEYVMKEKTIQVYCIPESTEISIDLPGQFDLFPGGMGGFRLQDGKYQPPAEELGTEGQQFYVCGPGTATRTIKKPEFAELLDIHSFWICDGIEFYYCHGDVSPYAEKPVVEAPKPAAPPVQNIPAAGTAYASTQMVSIDGKAVELQAYALKDAAGNPTNYVKLRDVAYAINGSAAQFEVGWDGSVNILTGKAYTPAGSEMKTPFSGNRKYTVPAAVTKVNGQASSLTAITLTDDKGGGYTYYKLRDLGKELGFNVGWSAATGIFIETDKPYTE